jgi:hypothetical protein
VTTYVDTDWIQPGRPDGASGIVLEDPDDSFAAAHLASVAHRAVETATRDSIPGSVAVTGAGIVAEHVRLLLAERGLSSPSASDERPAAVIDTTGSECVLLESLERLRDLGVLVLAAPVAPPALTANLYPDFHVRGLRIVGIRSAAAAALAGADPEIEAPPWYLEKLQHTSPGSLADAPQGWIRVDRRTSP